MDGFDNDYSPLPKDYGSGDAGSGAETFTAFVAFGLFIAITLLVPTLAVVLVPRISSLPTWAETIGLVVVGVSAWRISDAFDKRAIAWWQARKREPFVTTTDYPGDWDVIRHHVYARDGYRCSNCGAMNVELHAHHIVPLSVGGTNTMTNLVTLCVDCHQRLHPHMRS